MNILVWKLYIYIYNTGKTDYYTGLSEPSWKLRYANHKQNFKTDNQQNRTATCLSKHIWMLQDQNIDYSLKFKQIVEAQAFNPVKRMCRLCLSEKYLIMFKLEGDINARSEIFSACRHKTKLLLCPPFPMKKATPKSWSFQTPVLTLCLFCLYS